MKVFALTPTVSSSTYAASAERRIQNHFVLAFHALCLEEQPTSKNFLKKSSTSTPVKVRDFTNELAHHAARVFADHLITGMSPGFHVGVLSHLNGSYVRKSLQLAIKEPDLVS